MRVHLNDRADASDGLRPIGPRREVYEVGNYDGRFPGYMQEIWFSVTVPRDMK
tara:strand:- start:3 stop:161 length:159 start_codon:yes stop_codon:yes gene_type:complete